jgi:hypothetical protein
MRTGTQNLTLSALFIALGILFPVLFHGIGLGPFVLPMFWPLAVAAFYLPLSHALAAGALTPILSSMLTGMPPVSPPILHVLFFELLVFTGVIAWLYRRRGWRPLQALLAGLVASRLVLLAAVYALAPLFGLPPAVFSLAFVLKGIPGVLLILLVVPLLVSRLKGGDFRRQPLGRSS